jgi:hypothetical protein
VLIAVGGGLALASAVAAVPLELHAQALRSQFVVDQAQSSTRTISPSNRQAFSTARTWAYAAIGGAAGFGGAAAVCAAWYFFGPPRHEGALAPLINPEPRGASLQVSTGF